MRAPPTGPSANLVRLEKLEALVAAQARRLEEVERILKAIGGAFGVGAGAEVADDDDLDSKYGNSPIKRDPTPKFWTGPGFVGKKMSECSPEYLDAFAKYKDLCAKLSEKDGSEAKLKFASYDRKDAARARGWARRLRNGWEPPAPPPRPAFAGGSGFAPSQPLGDDPYVPGKTDWRSRMKATAPAQALAAAPPPAETATGLDDEDEDISFPFGANAAATGALTIDDEDDDDLALGSAGAAQ